MSLTSTQKAMYVTKLHYADDKFGEDYVLGDGRKVRRVDSHFLVKEWGVTLERVEEIVREVDPSEETIFSGLSGGENVVIIVSNN